MATLRMNLKKVGESSKGIEDQPSRKSKEQVKIDKKHCEENDEKKKTDKPLRKKAKTVKSSEAAGKEMCIETDSKR